MFAKGARCESVPAPIGGWNARDPLANMAATDAVILDNWFPRTGDVLLRLGSYDWATGLPGNVNSLMTYASPTGSNLFAGAGTEIFDVTSQGAVGASVYSGLTNVKFQYLNFTNTAGNFLYLVNGEDSAIIYNGVAWSNPSVTNLGGLTTADFSAVSSWKHRIFFVEKESMNLWYLGIDEISGDAHKIDFGSLFKAGGKIVEVATWTIDGGYGMDDNLVIITSKGEIAVYRGTDPTDADTFLLVGVYQAGSPVTGRCTVKYGGDLVFISQDGFLPMSAALQSTRVNNRVAISDKISNAVADATADYRSNYGWQAILFSKQNMLLFNIPVNPGIESQQFVMNTITKQWCRFTGWNANAFELVDDNLYFGANGKVVRAWDGEADSDVAIDSEVKTAFNYFKGNEKQFQLARPIFNSNQAPAPAFGLNVDFSDEDVTASIQVTQTQALWDVALWDVGVWGGFQIYKTWQGIRGVGFCAALRMKMSTTTLELSWAATDYVYTTGAIL